MQDLQCSDFGKDRTECLQNKCGLKCIWDQEGELGEGSCKDEQVSIEQKAENQDSSTLE
jgi:hypothetical protein